MHECLHPKFGHTICIHTWFFTRWTNSGIQLEQLRVLGQIILASPKPLVWKHVSVILAYICLWNTSFSGYVVPITSEIGTNFDYHICYNNDNGNLNTIINTNNNNTSVSNLIINDNKSNRENNYTTIITLTIMTKFTFHSNVDNMNNNNIWLIIT